jgi:hypothetical protein
MEAVAVYLLLGAASVVTLFFLFFSSLKID